MTRRISIYILLFLLLSCASACVCNPPNAGAEVTRERDEARSEGTRLLAVTRGCHAYNGGYSGRDGEVYHHGIATVIQALTAPRDSQTRALESIGCTHSHDQDEE